MSVQLVTIGHVLCETIIFADGARKGPVLGSPAAYAGAVAARLGTPTGIVTKFGPDAPAALLDPLKRAGVDLGGVDRSSPATTTNQLVYAADGTKELKYLKQAPPITIGDIPAAYRSARAFHICPLDYEVSPETVAAIAGLGGMLAIDLGGYGGAHVNRGPGARPKLSGAQLQALVRHFEIAKASDEDMRLIFEGEAISEREAARRLVAWGARIGIITLGARGSIVCTRENEFAVPALTGKVVDVTGGGDSYMAGFLVEYLKTGTAYRAALFASAVALYVIARTGGVLAERMPGYSDASALLSASRLSASGGLGTR